MYKWEPDKGTDFTVVDLHTGQVCGRCKAGPCFAYHHINCSEEVLASGHVIISLDMMCYDRVGYASLKLDDLRRGTVSDASAGAAVRRFTIKMKPGSASSITENAVIYKGEVELPTINPSFARQSYRFVYGLSSVAAKRGHRSESWGIVARTNRIVKLDMQTGQTIHWQEPHCSASEPIFVGRTSSAIAENEDEGCLLSVVFDYHSSSSYMLFLDARTLSEIARAAIPQHVPMSLHGHFAAASRL